MSTDFTSGSKPAQLKRLFSIGLEESDEQEDAARTVSLDLFVEKPGSQIGRYKLLKVLGEGGMGIVYLAKQRKPIEREVALKVIKPGMDSKRVIARFETEEQTLALLDHPNIAHVYDAGTTQLGRPYFVMEYVKGIPVTEHCDRQKLTIEQRLDMFLQVCDAIQYAHQKGIIHRDIKPSNILVSIHGERFVPKVIDFGVAKALGQPLTDRTLETEQGQMLGTPEYMSPEQVEMTSQDFDTRTDIYSLGVLLYRLMTGKLPFEPKASREGGINGLRHAICEESPKTPSTQVSRLNIEESTRLARLYQTDVGTLRRRLRGDLDWITLKALEKDRTRRYQTIQAFTEDIRRHLNDEPVLAGPPSKIYRLKKFLRKYRTQAIAAATAAVLLACIAVIFVMYVQAVNRGKEAESLKHRDILSKAMELRSNGQFQEALTKVQAIVDSEHVGLKARLFRAQLIFELKGPVDTVEELEKLLGERDEVAGQAHLLLAKIYYDSDPDAPGRTKEYRLKWEYHRQEAERLLPHTADAYLLRAMSAGTVQKSVEFLNKALELDERHYDSLRERAYLSYASKNFYKMAKDAARMTGIEPDNPLGYALSAVAQRQLGQFEEAGEDHNTAIEISPDDPELYDQRRQTLMRMGNYEEALLDARKCVELKPEDGIYCFHTFCALVALGRYDEAQAEYDRIIKSSLMTKENFDLSAAKYVSDTLYAGLLWYPPQRRPEGVAFLAMHESAEVYHQLAKKAERVVNEGFHPNWSPDGTKLVYTRGVLGSSGIEILNRKTGKVRLLTTPGKDPEWSPDGEYIVYVRDRQILPLGHLTVEYGGKARFPLREEVWLIKASGMEEPRFLASGGWASWSGDSKRVFYHSRMDNKLCSISIENGAKPTPLISCPSYHPAVSPDEKHIAYRVDNELRIVEISSSSIVAIWLVPLGVHQLLNWSPNGRELGVGDFCTLGFWIYDLKTKKPSKLLGGSFEWCSWSPSDMRQIAIGRTYWELHHEIWVAEAASLGPGRTIEQHCQEMVDFYTRRIKTDPENAENYPFRAECYIYLQDKEKALADFEQCAKLLRSRDHPAVALVTKLAVLYREQERYDEVEPVLVKVLALTRRILRVKHPLMLDYLAWLQATFPEAEFRDGAKAVENATKACELMDWKSQYAIDTLAAAYAEAGDFDAAVKWQKEAIDLLTEEQSSWLRAKFQARLILYQSGKPYRETP